MLPFSLTYSSLIPYEKWRHFIFPDKEQPSQKDISGLGM
jgi:hypothetical protein